MDKDLTAGSKFMLNLNHYAVSSSFYLFNLNT